MKTTPIIRLASLLLLGALTARAQDASVNVTFQTFGLNALPAKTTYGPSHLPLSAGVYVVTSKTYSYSGDHTMELDVPAPGPTTGGTPKMTPVGKAIFPSSGQYLLMTNTQDDGTVNAIPLSMAAADFPGGAVRFVNATGLPLTVAYNGKEASLDKNAVTTYKMSPAASSPIAVVFIKNGREFGTATNSVANDPSGRTTVFVVLTNAKDVKADPTNKPTFNLVEYADSPGAPPAAPAGTATSGRNGGTGRRGGRAGTSGNANTGSGNGYNNTPSSNTNSSSNGFDNSFGGPTPSPGG